MFDMMITTTIMKLSSFSITTALILLLSSGLHEGCDGFSSSSVSSLLLHPAHVTDRGLLSSSSTATLSSSGSFSRSSSKTTSTSTSQLLMSNSDAQGVPDRLLSCVPYLLPIMDGDRYGRYMYMIFPTLGMVDATILGPIKAVYYAIPFGSLIAFIALSTLSRNANISRPVRFNIQQALLLDIALIFPNLLGQVMPNLQLPAVVNNSCSNFVFYFLVASVGYSLITNLVTGKIPNQIPIISEASEMQIGP